MKSTSPAAIPSGLSQTLDVTMKKKSPWRMLIASWAAVTTAFCMPIVGSHFVWCRWEDCPKHANRIPSWALDCCFIGFTVVAAALLLIHLKRLEKWLPRIISLVLNVIAVFGLYIGSVVLYLEFAHWHK